LYRIGKLVYERALIVQGFDNAGEVEILKVAEPAVDDSKGVVRRGVAT
jgi:hypothetical protein